MYFFQSDQDFAPPPALPIQHSSTDRPRPAAVTPYRLCDECRSFCAALYYLVTPHRIRHYSSGFNIAKAAYSGCHLCSIILARLRYLPPGHGEEDRKWNEDNPCAIDSVVNQPLAKHKALRARRYLILDFHFPSDHYAQDRLNYGSVYLLSSQGSSPPPILSDTSIWRTSFASQPCFDLASTWLRRCRSKHPGCRSGAHSSPPERLLRLDDTVDGKTIKLTSSPYGPTPEYVSLSWRWPKSLPIRLTQSIIDAYAHGIILASLPQTFQDAVHVTRRLGFTHLWIDALCIVQDDEMLKSESIAHMDEVYGNSFLTIAVASAPELNTGFLSSRWPLSSHDCWLSEEGNITVIAKADTAENNECTPGHCPLDQRGWVCQERLLSPRTLYFSNEHLFWECRRKAYHEQKPSDMHQRWRFTQTRDDTESEDNEYLVDDPLQGSLKRCYNRILHLPSGDARGEWEQSLRSSWHLIVSSYTRSALTLEQDKMRALAGAAALIQKRFSLKSSFGLWQHFFLTDLLWRRILADGPFPDPTVKDAAPSWSWMSRNGHTINDWVTSMKRRVEYPDYYQTSTKAEVTMLPPETPFQDPLYRIPNLMTFATGVRGPLIEIEWGRDETERPGEWRADSGYFITTRQKRKLELTSGHEHLNRNFSADYILPAGLRLWCMLFTETLTSLRTLQDEQLGLVLEPVESDKNIFRRVGAMQLEYDNTCPACKIFPDDAPIVEILLI